MIEFGSMSLKRSGLKVFGSLKSAEDLEREKNTVFLFFGAKHIIWHFIHKDILSSIVYRLFHEDIFPIVATNLDRQNKSRYGILYDKKNKNGLSKSNVQCSTHCALLYFNYVYIQSNSANIRCYFNSDLIFQSVRMHVTWIEWVFFRTTQPDKK